MDKVIFIALRVISFVADLLQIADFVIRWRRKTRP